MLAAALLVTTLVMDVDGDGKRDLVHVAQGKSSIAVSVTYGDRRRKPDVFHFPVDPGREDAVCRLPVHLVKERNGFAVVDEACDSLHFFWNRKTKHLDWWRL